MNLHGDHNQCQGCMKFFNSTHAFEKHRTGEHEGNARRCLSTEEMEAKKMAVNARGFWVSEIKPVLNYTIEEEA